MVGKHFGDVMTSDQSKRWRSSAFVAVIAALVFLPLFWVETTIGTKGDSDFPLHVLYALDIKNGKPIPAFIIAHSAWQFLLLAFNAVLGLSFQSAELISILLCIGVTVSILYWRFYPAFEKTNLSLWQMVSIVLGMNVAAPVALLWFLDHQLYFGYVGIISYHNPTIILLRPLALLQFIYALRCFQSGTLHKINIPAAAVISLFATYAKPNFAICLLPAIALIALYKLVRKETVNLAFLIVGFLVPMIFVLAWQLWMTYTGGDSAHVIFSPLGVMSAYSGYLLPKFLLSILFPLVVTILYWKQASRDLPMVLAWLIFVFGSFFTYFVAESGPRFNDGNFTWSGEIALFVLFVVSTLFFIKVPKLSRLPKIAGKTFWLLHVAAGVIYYVYFTLHMLYIV